MTWRDHLMAWPGWQLSHVFLWIFTVMMMKCFIIKKIDRPFAPCGNILTLWTFPVSHNHKLKCDAVGVWTLKPLNQLYLADRTLTTLFRQFICMFLYEFWHFCVNLFNSALFYLIPSHCWNSTEFVQSLQISTNTLRKFFSSLFLDIFPKQKCKKHSLRANQNNFLR